MCDFKPGDEVVCVRANGVAAQLTDLREGEQYVIARVFIDQIAGNPQEIDVGVTLVGVAIPHPFTGFRASWFRKAQRRNLTEWLATKSTIEEPKRTPAKRRERA